MGVKITGRYTGTLGTEMVHEDSGAILKTAAPKDNMGDGSAFSPTDLLAASLASCVVTTMAIVAEREGIAFGNCKFEAEKHMGQGPRRISQIDLSIHLPASLSEEARKRLEDVAHKCPVQQSLPDELVVNAEFRYDLAD